MMLTFGSLFAGIGGFDLGFERAGMQCKWQVEIDPYCQKVLAKHWPNVARHDDVRTFPPGTIDDWRVDVICGGFPCQDISNAGKCAGIEGERSGLWSEFARIVCLLRPRFVVVENVADLLVRGMGTVLADLAEGGYDSEWQILPAAYFGAPHIRERVFIVANREGFGWGARWQGRSSGDSATATKQTHRPPVFDTASIEARSDSGQGRKGRRLPEPGIRCSFTGRPWAAEPDVGRVANGVPFAMDRTRGLGNAVVPQVAEWIGRRIIEASGVSL